MICLDVKFIRKGQLPFTDVEIETCWWRIF